MVSNERRYAGVGLEDLPELAARISGYFPRVTVWLFRGDLGAGKTTLIKAIGEFVGVTDAMSSPSFSIINEYETSDGGRLYHFDFYRIRSEAEAADIGVEEYFYSGQVCLIEWPEKIPSLIPAGYGAVNITFEDKEKRTIAISVHDGKEENRV